MAEVPSNLSKFPSLILPAYSMIDTSDIHENVNSKVLQLTLTFRFLSHLIYIEDKVPTSYLTDLTLLLVKIWL